MLPGQRCIKKGERILAFWVSPGFFLVENPGNEQSRNETIKRSSILNWSKEERARGGGRRKKVEEP